MARDLSMWAHLGSSGIYRVFHRYVLGIAIMAGQYSTAEYAYIESALDQKLPVGDGCVDIIMNFLGDGLCVWCERAPCEGTSNYCEDCELAFELLEEPYQ